ncbi:MAG: hypothetical protein R2705_10830 [Ilumatobacteraceae bacterium]
MKYAAVERSLVTMVGIPSARNSYILPVWTTWEYSDAFWALTPTCAVIRS